jgi:hypothetical protein
MLAQNRFGELTAILGEPQTTMLQVLDLPYVTQAARYGFPALRTFVAPHSAELLKLAFSQHEAKLSTTAFKILNCGDCEYLRPLFESDVYRNNALELITQKDPPAFLLGRLASMTVIALVSLGEIACDNCGFIYRLLPYCENPTVFNLFETLTSDDDRVEFAQKWLKDFGFCEYIPREVTNIPFDYVSELTNIFQDPVYNKAFYLFQLIARGLRNNILGDEFRTESVVQCLQRQFPKMPDFVQISRWDALFFLVSETNAESLDIFVNEALRLLSEPFRRLKKYHVSALAFITRMMRYVPAVYETLQRSGLPSMMGTVVLGFPNSTILHNAFIEFIEVGLSNLAFADRVIRLYVPIISVHGESDNRILKSVCIRLMELFLNVVKKQPKLKSAMAESSEGNKFIKDIVLPFRKKSQGKYGGMDSPIDFSMLRKVFSGS